MIGVYRDYTIFLFSVIIILGLLHHCMYLGELVGDVRAYYIPAGEYYIRGRDHSSFNWEHPPLAKYLIGLSVEYWGSVFYVSVSILLLGIFYLWLLLKDLTRDSLLATLIIVSLSLDGIFLEISASGILDVFMVSFSIPAVYYAIRYIFREAKVKYLVMSSFFSGLCIACKWSLIPLVFTLFLYILYVSFEKRHASLKSVIKGVLMQTIFIIIVLIVYCSSYVMFFLHGHSLLDLIVLQVNMVGYHRRLNFPTLWTSMNGLLKLFLNVSIFKTYLYGNFTESTTIVNGTQVVYYVPASLEYKGLHIYFFTGLGGLGRMLFIPLLFYLFYLMYKDESIRFEGTFFVAIALSATLICLSSNLDWYTYDALWYWYILLGYITSIVGVRKGRKIAGIILFLNALSFILLNLNHMAFDTYL